jgi:hypothetical protein
MLGDQRPAGVIANRSIGIGRGEANPRLLRAHVVAKGLLHATRTPALSSQRRTPTHNAPPIGIILADSTGLNLVRQWKPI